MGEKVRYVAGVSENNSEVRKKEQTCSVETKSNIVDGRSENKSRIRKRKCVPDKIEEKKKKKKKENRNNIDSHVEGNDEDKSQIRKREVDGPDKFEKENRNNVDRGTESNSEDRIREQNCQVNQNDYDMDRESEKHAEVRQREEIIILKEKDSNADGSGKNKSQMRERGDVPETIGKKRKKRKKKNRNNEDNGIENNSEDRTREQNYQVDSVDGESVFSSAGREEKQNFTVEQKDDNADARTEKKSKFRKRGQNCLWKPKGSNLNGSGESKCQTRKEEGDMPNEIEKRKEKNGHRADGGEQSCHMDQEDCNLDGEEGTSNSDIRGRQHHLNIENKSQVRRCDKQNVRITKKNKDDMNEGIETNFEVKRRELNCQQKDTNADEESELIPIVRNGEQNASTVDGGSERIPKVRIVRDAADDRIASKKKTMNSVDDVTENNSKVTAIEQNTSEVRKGQQNYLMEQIDNDVKGNIENKLVARKREREMPDDKIAKKKKKKRKLKNAQKP